MKELYVIFNQLITHYFVHQGASLKQFAIFIYLFTLLLWSSLSYASTVVSYNFDGNLLDTSGNGNDASIIGGGATYVNSSSGKAISLNGSQHLVMPNNLIRNQTDFTVTVKFKADPGATGGILGYQNVQATTTATEWIPLISIDTSGRIRVELWTTNSGMSLTSTATVDDSNWHTVVMTGDVNANSLNAYLDGTSIGSASGQIVHLSMSYNQIGVSDSRGRGTLGGTSTDYFTGEIDDFSVTNTATAASEVAKTTQSISFASINTQTGSSLLLSATASSGLAVTYTSNSTSVCTVSGSTATYVSNGTCTIVASQSGDATYSAAQNVQNSFSWTYSAPADPTKKEDVIKTIEMDTIKAVEFTRQSFRAVNTRFQWLKNNAATDARSHQGIRFNFADPYVHEFFNGSSSGFETVTLTEVASKLRSYGSANGDTHGLSKAELQAEIEDNATRMALGEMREKLGISTLNPTGGPVAGEWALWTEGQITVGKYFQDSASSKQNSDGYTLTVGMDKPFMESGVIGGALTFGKDKVDVGSSGSNVETDNYSLAFYTGFEMAAKVPLEFTLGTGRMNFDNTRIDGSQTLTGKRKGNALFASAKMYQNNIKSGKFDFSPYSLVETSRIWMSAFTEAGGSMALDYDKQIIDQAMLSFGAEVNYLTYYRNGRLVPFGTVEMGADLSGSSDAVMRYVGQTTDYRLRLDKLSDYHWLLRAGFDYHVTDVLMASMSVERYEAIGAGHADTFRLRLSNSY